MTDELMPADSVDKNVPEAVPPHWPNDQPVAATSTAGPTLK